MNAKASSGHSAGVTQQYARSWSGRTIYVDHGSGEHWHFGPSAQRNRPRTGLLITACFIKPAGTSTKVRPQGHVGLVGHLGPLSRPPHRPGLLPGSQPDLYTAAQNDGFCGCFFQGLRDGRKSWLPRLRHCIASAQLARYQTWGIPPRRPRATFFFCSASGWSGALSIVIRAPQAACSPGVDIPRADNDGVR